MQKINEESEMTKSLSSSENYIPMSKLALKSKFSFIKNYESTENFEDQSCYICGKNKFNEINNLDRYGFYYPTGICTFCGNIQQIRYYDQKTLEVFYREYYRDIYDPESPNKRFIHQRDVLGNEIYKFVKDLIQPKHVLEIGCGSGGILKKFQNEGSSVLGLDYDDRFIAEGRRNDIEIRKGSLETLDSSERFDCIILSHVLEHIVDPGDMLEEIKKYLLQDGIVYIEVPSLNSLLDGMYGSDIQQYFQNAHTIHFSTDSLRNLAISSGYEILKSDNFIRSIWRKASSDEINQIFNHFNKSLDLMTKIKKNKKSKKMRFIRLKNKIRSSLATILEFLGIKKSVKKILKWIV